jgi:glyoxylase-like metal-dependent hydrolase (beta-lactamase superfamily II)/SAM-dependent methyltransferase
VGPGRLIPVNERVWSATGYGVANILYVVAGRNVVVIDTTESVAAAAASFEEFRRRYSLPVSQLIYTHHHGDHVRGATVFRGPATEVIGQRQLPEEMEALHRIRAYRQRSDVQQFGLLLGAARRSLRVVPGSETGYVAPSFLVDEEWRFDEGDLTFELYHTQGETVDHLMVWQPETKTLFPGDLFYGSFPMLSSPMKAERPVLAWAESLDRMRALQPEYFVPSHGVPRWGRQEIDTVLSNYARAIRHVHDETLAGMNRGQTLEEIRAQVALPDDLRGLPYLQERYGSVGWAVVGIFHHYAGWYGASPAELDPADRSQLYGAILEASGGAGPLIVRAQSALEEGEAQLALELSDVVLTVRPGSQAARAVRWEALRQLGDGTDNGVARNIYRTAAQFPGRIRVLNGAALTAPAGPATGPVTGPATPAAGVGKGRPGAGAGAGAGVPALGLGVPPGRRLAYAGVWFGPLPGSAPSRPRRPVGVRSGPGGPGSAPAAGELGVGRGQAVTLINDWYDDRMYQKWEGVFYEGSDFHNFGYWTPGTHSARKACEDLMEMLLAFLPRKTGSLLDVACGKGASTRYLSHYYPPDDVVGINISEKQLETSRRNAPGSAFVAMDATALGFHDASFDNVLCVEAAFHFVTRARFIAEAFRVLKPGGRLILSDRLSDPARPQANTPWASNLTTGPEQYRNSYLEAGFERLEIVDTTSECEIGYKRHRLALLRGALAAGRVGLPAFYRERNKLFAQIQSDRRHGYYLLVCAQKPM